MNYFYTRLEDDIRNLYLQMSITYPEQLDLKEIASKLNIDIYYSKAITFRSGNAIVLKKGLTKQQEWQMFGHELKHFVSDIGNQFKMPESFLNYQETKANNFMYHFCVPTFMLEKLEFPWRKNEAILMISDTFNVEIEFAKKRLDLWLQNKTGYMFHRKISESFVKFNDIHNEVLT